MRFSVLIALLVAVGAPLGVVHAWQQRLGHSYYVFEGMLTVGRDGSSFIDIGRKAPGNNRVIAIEKRNRRGEPLWRNGLRDGSRRGDAEELAELVEAPDGDVVGAGSWREISTLVVFRLSGRDGRRQWIHTASGSDHGYGEQLAYSVAIDGHGDVVAGGTLQDGADEHIGDVTLHNSKDTFFVTKLDGRTGGTVWEHRIVHPEKRARDFVHKVLVDDADDVFALARLTTGNLDDYYTVVTSSAVLKLDGTTGAERWRTLLPDTMQMGVMARASTGDVFVAGHQTEPYVYTDMVVAALDPAGHVRWTHRIETPGAIQWEETFALITTTEGDPVAGGITSDANDATQFTVVRLDHATGEERWRTVIPSTDGFDGGGIARSLAVGPGGTIVAGGTLSTPAQCADLAVVELSPEAGVVERTTTIDGTTTATSCFHDEDCERPPCGDPRAGIDRDNLTSLRVTADGRVVITGETCDGPHAKHHGLLASWRLR